MREASKRLAESLFDSYENDWAGEEDLGAIVEVRVILFCCTKATELSTRQGTQTCISPPP